MSAHAELRYLKAGAANDRVESALALEQGVRAQSTVFP